MALPAFKEEFDEVVAAMPPLPRLVFSRSGDNDPLAGIGQRARASSGRLDDWHSQIRRWIPQLRAVVQDAFAANDVESLETMINRQIPAFVIRLDQLLHSISLGEVELKQVFGLMTEGASGNTLRAVKAAEEDVAEAFFKCRKIVVEMRDGLKAIEWDFDPDTKGGPAFENAEDLIASLNS